MNRELRSTLLASAAVAAIALWFSSIPVQAQTPPSADELLARSIEYHDPDGLWIQGAFEMQFSETRPNGPDRESTTTLDNAEGYLHIARQRDGSTVERSVRQGVCTFLIDGSSDYSEETAKERVFDCDRMKRMRDYYDYLWGLPMKLRDPGTRLAPEVRKARFEGQETLELKVTYDEKVGKDTWYFYFEPSTAALIGYRFYHDESANDGEYIVLRGEQAIEDGGMRLPKERTWYTHQDDRLLGTDTLVSFRRLER